MTKKLSILLPIYNQPEDLKRLLVNLMPQITPEIEVLVRDDSTTPDCYRIIKEYKNITYTSGKKLGVDGALKFLLERARGEYVWWLGDDDITPDAISKILTAIDKSPNFIWANNRMHNRNNVAVDLPESGFVNKNELLVKAGTGVGFISSCIMRKTSVSVEKAEKTTGTEFFSMHCVLQAMSNGRNYYIKEPIVIVHPNTSEEIKQRTVKGKEINNAAFQVFGINFKNILKQFPFSKEAIRKTIKGSFGQTWRGVLVASVGGWDTTKGKNLKVLKHFWSYPEAWIAFVMFSMPLFMNKLLYKIYKQFFNERKLIRKPDWRVGHGIQMTHVIKAQRYEKS